MSSDEFFYRDAQGNKQDAELHAELLENEEADALTQRRSMENGRARGVDWKVLKILYPKAFPPNPLIPNGK